MRLLAKLTKQRLLVGLMCLSAVAALFGPSLAGWIRLRAQWVLAPFGDAGIYLTTTIRSHVGKPVKVTEDDLHRLERENDVLRAYVADLQAEVDALRHQIPAIASIYGQVPPSRYGYTLIPARVVLRDALAYGRTGLLNTGRSRGARPPAAVTTRRLLTDRSKALDEDLPALTETALVGRVTHAWAFGATLQLVIDPAYEVRARIHRLVNAAGPRRITIIEKDNSRTEPLRDGKELARLFDHATAPELDDDARAVLAIVAYNGPITRRTIESLRGEPSAAAIERLLAARLIGVAPRGGAAPAGGDPYAVTTHFLRVFALSSLDELRGNNRPIDCVARGDGTYLAVADVRLSDNVLPGDLLATCPDEYLPAPVAIGKVVEVAPDPDKSGCAIVRAAPTADLDGLRHVFIVVTQAPEADR